MRNLFRNTVLILGILLLSVYLIVPPAEKLRRGKDLAGGVSLTYQVELKPTDPAGTMQQVIDLLKRRLDPDGLLEISIVQQGSNRLEVTMPLPSDRVKQLRKEFDDAIAALSEGALTVEQFNRMMRSAPEQRAADIARVAGQDKERLDLLNQAAAASDAAREADRAYRAQLPALRERLSAAEAALTAARTGGATPEALAAAQKAVDDAQAAILDGAKTVAAADTAFDKLRTQTLATAINAADVRRAFELSDRSRRVPGDKPGQPPVDLPSPRSVALERLKANHPGAAERLDAVLAKFQQYQKERSTLDDPADLKRLLRGAGILEFRIAAGLGEVADEARLREELRRGGPKASRSVEARWFKLNKLDGWYDTAGEARALNENPAAYFAQQRNLVADTFDGEIYLLLFDTPEARLTQAEGGWKVAAARPSIDDLGRPCIAFTMDELGADRMGTLTSRNKGRPLTVLLDDQVYTVATIQSRIGRSGQITGTFSNEEISYVVRTLAAGSLAARLSPDPISENTIGPELGADNLNRGLTAGVVSFVLVSGFMIVYYFSGGWIAVFALLINALLILALMALNKAAFSLPGIAGVILTFGMAVDANVLIYERMREEILRGADLRTAVRLAYAKALSAIVDGNVTNLIVCVVLAFTGTPEIRGFAITMSIGVVTTLFCQLFVTRVIYTFLVEKVRWTKVSMLPLAIPALNRFLLPNINWLQFKTVFIVFSSAVSLIGIGAVIYRGQELLDNEFRGGTRVTVQFRTDEATGRPITKSRAQVQEQLEKTTAELAKDPAKALLRTPMSVIIVNPEPGNVSSRFVIKTTLTDTAMLSDAISTAFKSDLDVQEALTFDGSTAGADLRQIPVRPITVANLGEVIDRPEITADVTDFLGGAAIVLNNIKGGDQAPTLASLETRLRQMRDDPQFREQLGRPHRFVVIDGDERAVRSAVLLVSDPGVSFLTDQARWTAEVKLPEWKLTTEALARASTLAGVESFSASIARAFAAQAIVAVILSGILIIIYVWVRFAAFRYSLAAMLSTLHDCIVAVGMIALAGVFVKYFPGPAAAIGLLDFKIDLNVVAAVLTILGYSLNDSIVIMDRIRENRGKLTYASAAVINRSVNETISRTIITGGSTIIATTVLYIYGGEAIRAFAFCFLVGVLVGTYSSVAIAAPLVWSRKSDPTSGGVAPTAPTEGGPAPQPA